MRRGLPWQPRLMHPPRGKPHARVIVKIAGSHKLVREIIDRPVTGLAFFNAPDGRILHDRIKVLQKVAPHLGLQGQPRFPVTPPIHLLNKFLHPAERVGTQNRGDHFFLGDQAVADRRGKPGDGWVAEDDVIPVARIMFGDGNEPIEFGEGCGARRGTHHSASCPVIKGAQV